MDGGTDGRRDTADYRYAQTHLKTDLQVIIRFIIAFENGMIFPKISFENEFQNAIPKLNFSARDSLFSDANVRFLSSLYDDPLVCQSGSPSVYNVLYMYLLSLLAITFFERSFQNVDDLYVILDYSKNVKYSSLCLRFRTN